jgi:hypothetical protein
VARAVGGAPPAFLGMHLTVKRVERSAEASVKYQQRYLYFGLTPLYLDLTLVIQAGRGFRGAPGVKSAPELGR